MVACRLNWLKRIQGETLSEEEWYDEKADFAALHPRFAAAGSRWTDFLASLDQAGLAQEFEFAEREERLRLPTEVQIIHLFGHASYHRGQVAVLVNQLSGEVPIIDYEDWWCGNRREQVIL